ncbi:MAG TPA: riboflavin synthase [Fimbriimonadaceae bacterium]|nr:riboflavin synthase [Fimbriimonadaceae bacterium]HRJ33117.1 riboflavin synthase [Fimbriimonadaceae bacterium]
MFTGIIEHVGRLASLNQGRLTLDFDPAWTADEPIQIGESIAVNGCCLTAVTSEANQVEFDLSQETLDRTALGQLRPGGRVNLERAMRLNGRLGGHLVLGHVDAVGTLKEVTPTPSAIILTVEAPAEGAKYLIDKGSIAVDGISLTLVEPRDSVFRLWIIPHTWEATHLSERQPGDLVNLEFDVLAKFTERLLAASGKL